VDGCDSHPTREFPIVTLRSSFPERVQTDLRETNISRYRADNPCWKSNSSSMIVSMPVLARMYSTISKPQCMETGQPFSLTGLLWYSGEWVNTTFESFESVAQTSDFRWRLMTGTEKICAPPGFNVRWISFRASEGWKICSRTSWVMTRSKELSAKVCFSRF